MCSLSRCVITHFRRRQKFNSAKHNYLIRFPRMSFTRTLLITGLVLYLPLVDAGIFIFIFHRYQRGTNRVRASGRKVIRATSRNHPILYNPLVPFLVRFQSRIAKSGSHTQERIRLASRRERVGCRIPRLMCEPHSENRVQKSPLEGVDDAARACSRGKGCVRAVMRRT